MSDRDSSHGDGGDNNIQVFVRIRPPGPDEPTFTRVVDVSPNNKSIILKQEPNPRVFSFDYVADIDSKQETIFSSLGKKVIENCVAGYNGTIFAYGQTGSGKTYTMLGPSEDADNFQLQLRGVIPRSFEYLYNLITRERELHGENKEFLCKCSFLEIYNEQIFDLLEPSPTSLHLRESLKTGVYVSGLSEQVVADASEAYEVLNSGWVNRKVASTSMNRESSRSHAVFTLQIESKERKGAIEHIRTSALNLVDLAGSERQKDTGASGIRLKEAGSINKSLSNLGNVIMCLVSASREGKKRFIPYRDSKLTFLLRDSLGGNSKTSLIACVHPGHKCFGETLSTLQFAKRAKMIKNKAVLNENSLGNIQQLQSVIKALKDELQKYKTGLIPQEPTIAPAECMPVLREMFLHAMLLKQKAETDKLELHTVMQKLREVSDKKDKAIQTNKMIIKFRDSNIKRLEEKLKGGDAKDSQKEDLLHEIDALRSQVDHHPLVTKHSLEVQTLKSTIRSLKEDSGILSSVHKDAEKVHQLEEEYHRLVAEQQDSSDEDHVTPQRADTVSTATLEKLQSQVADLESRIDELNQESSEMRKSNEKKELYMKGELESYKKTVAELEMVLSANNTRTKLEKEAMSQMHRQTVLTITTPKKECYNLRNRTVITKFNTPDLDGTIPFENESPALETLLEEEGILEETLPEDVAQQAQEALLDQIKQLQESNGSMETRLAEYDTERVKQSHQQAVLEAQLKSIEELLEKERHVLGQVEPKLREALEERENAVGETQDLRLLLNQADKDIKDYKAKLKKERNEKTDEVEKIQSKMAEVDRTFEQLSKQNEKLLEENEILELSLETELATRQFQESLAVKFEENLIQEQGKVKKLEQYLQNAEKTILDERDHRESLVNQLNCEGVEKDKEVLRQFDENKNLQIEYESLKNMLEAHEGSAFTLRTAIEDKESKVIQLEKTLKLTEEKVVSYFNRLEEQRCEMTEVKQMLESSDEQINIYKEKEETYGSSIQELNAVIELKEKRLEMERQKHQVDIEMLNEDVKTYQENIEDLQREYERSQIQILRSEETRDRLSQEVTSLTDTLKVKEEATATLSSTHMELDELINKLNALEAVRVDRTNENSQLKLRIQDVEKKCEVVTSELELLNAEHETVYEKLKCQSCEISDLMARCTSAEMKAARVGADRNQAQSRLMELQNNIEEKEREITDLKETDTRLKSLADRDNVEKIKLKSELYALQSGLKGISDMYTYKFPQNCPQTESFQFQDLFQRIRSLKEEHEKLMHENNDLIGHNNMKQKIRYHMQVKNENVALKNDVASLEDKNRHLQDEVKELRRQIMEHSAYCA